MITLVLEENGDEVKLDALKSMADLLEVEEEKYQKVILDPFVNERDNHEIGNLISLIIENEQLIDELETCFLRQNVDMSVAAARIFIIASPVVHPSIFSEETARDKLISFVKDSTPLLQNYSTGVLAMALAEREVADTIVRTGLATTLLSRLKALTNAVRGDVEGEQEAENSASSSTASKKRGPSNKLPQNGPFKRTRLSLSKSAPSKTEEVIQMDPMARKELIHILQCMVSMGEYQEVLQPIIEEDALDIVLFLMAYFANDKFVLHEVLRMLCSFLAHKKFATEFVDHGGMKSLLGVPREPYVTGSVALCFLGLASLSMVMEKICLLPDLTSSRLVSYSLWLISSSHETARKNGALFFNMALSFRTILQLFDEQDGLRILINLISTVNFAEQMTPLVELVVHHACLALRQYFRMHLNQACDQTKRRVARNSRDHQAPPPAPAYKLTQVDTNSTNACFTFIEKNYVPFLQTIHRWKPVELFIKYDAIQTLLQLSRMAQEWNMLDLVRLIYETLQVVSLTPNTHSILAVNTVPPLVPPEEGDEVINDTGISIMLNFLDDRGPTNSDIRLCVLQVICNLVCRQFVNKRRPSISFKPLPPPPMPAALSVQPAQQSQPGPHQGSQASSSSQLTAAPVGTLAAALPAAQPVPSVAQPASASANQDSKHASDELARAVWQAVRSHHGIKILLTLLKTSTPVTRADEIRTIACKALLGLSRSGTVKQILSKLQVSQLLSELVREPLLEDNAAFHTLFKEYAMLLIRSTTGKDNLSLFAADEVTDPTAKKLERAAIVAMTEIQYPEDELLSVIYDHLKTRGLNAAAETLLKEANLNPEKIRSVALLQSGKTPVRHSTLATAISTSKKTSAPGWVDAAPPQPVASSTNTLTTIVTQFLRDQHAHCSNPVAVLPPFSLLTQHHCPQPRHVQLASTNIASRLSQRQIHPPAGGYGGMRSARRFLYSRFRSVRHFKDEESVIASATFLGHEGDRLVTGTQEGEVKVFDVHSGQNLSSNSCHDSMIWSVVPSRNQKMLLTSSIDEHNSLSSLWSLDDLNEPKHNFEEDYSLLFSAGNDRLVGTSKDSVARIYSTETAQTIVTLYDHASNHYESNVACFNHTDDLVLNDGILWDPRAPRKIHKFDKFSNFGGSKFHPNGFEIILNSEIWDLRTFKLLRTCHSLDKTRIRFNSKGDVIFGVPRKQDKRDAFSPFGTSFRTFDSLDFSPISTIDVGKMIFDLCVHPEDSYIAVVESGTEEHAFSPDSACRLYEVGRKRPTESDSDLEDAESEGSESEEADNDFDDFGEEVLPWSDMDLPDDDDEDDDDDDDDEDEDEVWGDEDDEDDDDSEEDTDNDL